MEPDKQNIKDMNLVKAVINQYDGWEGFLCVLMDVAEAQNKELLSEYLWQALEKGHWQAA